MNRDFKGVWIPAELWLDKTLNPLHKMFLLECDSLDDPKTGCFASNAHFSEMFGVTKGRCSQIFKELERDGWITIRLQYDGKQIIKRTIRVVNPLNRGVKYTKPPYLENAQGSSNKSSNNKRHAQMRAGEISFDDFWSSWRKKVDRKKAETAWKRLSVKDQQKALADSRRRYKETEKRFIPNPTTYIHGERWNDESSTGSDPYDTYMRGAI